MYEAEPVGLERLGWTRLVSSRSCRFYDDRYLWEIYTDRMGICRYIAGFGLAGYVVMSCYVILNRYLKPERRGDGML